MLIRATIYGKSKHFVYGKEDAKNVSLSEISTMEILLEILKYTLPALLVILVTYLILRNFLNNEESKRLYHLKRETQKEAFPIRLQAYERYVLFLERISPPNLLRRVKGHGLSVDQYRSLLAQTIRTEFDHNLAQQIYVSPEAYKMVKAARDATLNIIGKSASELDDKADGSKLGEAVLTNYMDQEMGPSERAIHYIKAELREEF
jgi:hypothetical protein